MKRKVRPSTRTCYDCQEPFLRSDESDKQWDATNRCSPCRVENLKQRIRTGSPVDANGCWVWAASTRNGYGQMSVNDATTYTHQLSYRLFVGEIPAGLEVCHKCDVRRCNNPEHFFLGTQQDNVSDMWEKGRGQKPPVHRGLANANAKLTIDQVAEVRRRVASGESQRDVARAFACSQSTVWRLAHGITRAQQ